MSFWNERGERPIILDGMIAFYLNALVRGVVFSMIGIFVPIFVYTKLGEWYGMGAGVVGVASYYLILRTTVLGSVMAVSHLMEKIGFRRSITLSLIFYITNLWVLASAQTILSLVMAAILGGLVVPFYWVARHSAIAQEAEVDKIGRELSWLGGAEAIAALIAPLLGGLIIARYGYPTLFGFGVVMLAMSIIPLWLMPPHTHQNGASYRGWWRYLTDRRYFHQAVGMLGIAASDYGILIFWPLVVYLGVGNTEMVGWLFGVSAGVALLVRLVLGRWFDTLRARGGYWDEMVFVVLSLLVAGLLWVRMIPASYNWYLLIEVASAACGTAYLAFWANYFHLGGKRMSSIAYYVYGELTYSLAVIVMMLMVIVGVYLGVWREIIYLTAGLWVVFSIVMGRESNLRPAIWDRMRRK